MGSFGKFLVHGREWAKHKYIKKTPEKGYTRYWYTETGPDTEKRDLPTLDEWKNMTDEEKSKSIYDAYINEYKKNGIDYEEVMKKYNANELTISELEKCVELEEKLAKRLKPQLHDLGVDITSISRSHVSSKNGSARNYVYGYDILGDKISESWYTDENDITRKGGVKITPEDKRNSSSNYKLQKSEDSDDNILTKKNKDGSQTTIYKDSDGNLRKNTYYSDHSKDTSEKLDNSSNEAQAANRLLNAKKKEKIKHSALLGEAFIQDYLGVEID